MFPIRPPRISTGTTSRNKVPKALVLVACCRKSNSGDVWELGKRLSRFILYWGEVATKEDRVLLRWLGSITTMYGGNPHLSVATFIGWRLLSLRSVGVLPVEVSS